MPCDALTAQLGLYRPTLGELVPKMDAVRLARVHEDMRRRVTYIVTDTALQTDLTQVRTLVRQGRIHRPKATQKHYPYDSYAHAHNVQYTKSGAKVQLFFEIHKFLRKKIFLLAYIQFFYYFCTEFLNQTPILCFQNVTPKVRHSAGDPSK